MVKRFVAPNATVLTNKRVEFFCKIIFYKINVKMWRAVSIWKNTGNLTDDER